MLKFIRFVTSGHGALFLVRNFCWHIAVADIELPVEMGQFSACVLEKEFAVQREGCCEHIGEQETTVGEDVCRVRFPDHDLEGDEKLKLAHQGEADGEHYSDCDEKSVRDHVRAPGILASVN